MKVLIVARFKVLMALLLKLLKSCDKIIHFCVGSFRLLKDCNAFTFMAQQILHCVAVKMRVLQFFEMSGTTQHMTQSHMAEDVGRHSCPVPWFYCRSLATFS